MATYKVVVTTKQTIEGYVVADNVEDVKQWLVPTEVDELTGDFTVVNLEWDSEVHTSTTTEINSIQEVTIGENIT